MSVVCCKYTQKARSTEPGLTAVGTRCAVHATPLYLQALAVLSPISEGLWSVYFAFGLKATVLKSDTCSYVTVAVILSNTGYSEKQAVSQWEAMMLLPHCSIQSYGALSQQANYTD
jgi:hypothetical protein